MITLKTEFRFPHSDYHQLQYSAAEIRYFFRCSQSILSHLFSFISSFPIFQQFLSVKKSEGLIH